MGLCLETDTLKLAVATYPGAPFWALQATARSPPSLLSFQCAASWPFLPSQQCEPHPRFPLASCSLRDCLLVNCGLDHLLLISTAKLRLRVQPLCPAPSSAPRIGPLLPTPMSPALAVFWPLLLQAQPRLRSSLCPLIPLPATTSVLASPPRSHPESTSTPGLWGRSCVIGPFQNHASGGRRTCMGE